MIVKLIINPWVSDKLPEGLTIGNTYKCIEIFNSNPYDKYFRIINDNGEEDAWNSCFFEVIEEENKEKQVYCTNCRHLKLEEIHKGKGDYIVSCPHEKECEIFDVDDSRPLSERPYYEEE